MPLLLILLALLYNVHSTFITVIMTIKHKAMGPDRCPVYAQLAKVQFDLQVDMLMQHCHMDCTCNILRG